VQYLSGSLCDLARWVELDRELGLKIETRSAAGQRTMKIAMESSDSEWSKWRERWEEVFCNFVKAEMQDADPGHDLAHVRRVVRAAVRIGEAEGAAAAVVLPAAWLHDCVVVPKNSPQRNQASRMAAERAAKFMGSVGYENALRPAIEHAIIAHSFSAQVAPKTAEAKVVQDADRLEAIGALGLARCLMTGGAMGTQLVDAEEPFPVNRVADDAVSSVDHLFVKLLRLPHMMQTATGKVMAEKRVVFLEIFLRELADELYVDHEILERALAKVEGRQSKREDGTELPKKSDARDDGPKLPTKSDARDNGPKLR
jgi:uncharacterized protein